jgi:FkbM family methyltransferase
MHTSAFLSQIKNRLKQNQDAFLYNFVRQNHNKAICQVAAFISHTYLKLYMNQNYWNLVANGESMLIKKIVRNVGRPIVAFDVGANEGGWTAEVRNSCPGAEVHCFEIAPQMFEELTKHLSGHKGVHLRPFGLSDTTQQVEFTYFPNSNTFNSIKPLPWKKDGLHVSAQVRTGFDYIEQEGLNVIDLLKVDTEGHDIFVLRGFGDFLKRAFIKAIQFEYGVVCIPPRVFLGDFYELLAPRGYKIGRLHPNGVRFKVYDPFEDEHFRDGNYIAVHSEQTSLIQDLAL